MVSTGKEDAKHVDEMHCESYIQNYTNMAVIRNLGHIDRIRYVKTAANRFGFYPLTTMYNISYFMEQNYLSYDNPPIIGVGNPHYWIYHNIYRLIDSGGTYLSKNPMNAPSKPPVYTQEMAMDKLQLDMNMIKSLYRHTRHPKFIRQLADKFIRKNFKDKNFSGLHWRFNINDFLGRSKNVSMFDDAAAHKKIAYYSKGITIDMKRLLYEVLDDPKMFLNYYRVVSEEVLDFLTQKSRKHRFCGSKEVLTRFLT